MPGALVLFDLKRTLRRFRVLTSHGVSPDLDPQASYLQGAQEVFAADDKVMVFVFGHTHAAFLKRLGPAGQVVLNTGTWLKLLSRVPVRFGLLPAVYYPSYRLNYFRIEGQDRRLVIVVMGADKALAHEIALLKLGHEETRAELARTRDEARRVLDSIDNAIRARQGHITDIETDVSIQSAP